MMQLPRNAQLWLPALFRQTLQRSPRVDGEQTVWLILADHFEPLWHRPSPRVAVARVASWRTRWPGIAARHRDHLGRPPQYTFFFAEEEYRPELVEPLAELTRLGIADVEVHIHHDGEGEHNFVERMSRFVNVLHHDHGLLRIAGGKPVFGFIHGNWALDNSHPRGHHCGLNNELTLLRELGCYADFTLPAAPDPCQTRTVNSIYWAVDDVVLPRSHDRGTPVKVGAAAPKAALLIVQGPLALRWFDRRWLSPALEVGEVAGHDPVTRRRVRTWLSVAPRIGAHQFVKLHTHGAPEKNAAPLLDHELDRVFTGLRDVCDERGSRVVFATAWQAAQAIEAIAAGQDPLSQLTGSPMPELRKA